MLMGFGVLRLLGLSIVMILCLLSWRWLPGLLLRSSIFSISDVKFSSSQGFGLGPVVAAGFVV